MGLAAVEARLDLLAQQHVVHPATRGAPSAAAATSAAAASAAAASAAPGGKEPAKKLGNKLQVFIGLVADFVEALTKAVVPVDQLAALLGGAAAPSHRLFTPADVAEALPALKEKKYKTVNELGRAIGQAMYKDPAKNFKEAMDPYMASLKNQAADVAELGDAEEAAAADPSSAPKEGGE